MLTPVLSTAGWALAGLLQSGTWPSKSAGLEETVITMQKLTGVRAIASHQLNARETPINQSAIFLLSQWTMNLIAELIFKEQPPAHGEVHSRGQMIEEEVAG